MPNTSFPNFTKNLKLEDFYQSKRKAFVSKKVSKHKVKYHELTYFFLLFAVSVTVFVATFITKNTLDPRISASNIERRATFFLYPSDTIVDKGSTFSVTPKIVVLSDKYVAATVIALKFDNTMLKANQIKPYDTVQTNMKILKSSTFDEANQSGVFKIFVGTQNPEKPPFKVVSLPQITFQRLKAGVTIVNVDTTESKATFLNQEEADVAAGSSVTVN
jgi:hypothetical protein